MGSSALVGLRQGEAVVSALEKAGLDVVVAMWAHLPEYETWRLVLASRDLDKRDLGDAYGEVSRILKDAGLTIWDTPSLHIMKTTDSFIRAIRRTYKDSPRNTGFDVSGQSWAGRFVDDGYAYKIA
jgi:hypothetical protein